MSQIKDKLAPLEAKLPLTKNSCRRSLAHHQQMQNSEFEKLRLLMKFVFAEILFLKQDGNHKPLQY